MECPPKSMSGMSKEERGGKETEELNVKRQLVMDAEGKPDLLADLPMFRRFDRKGVICDLLFYQHFPQEYREWGFELTERHMKTFYEGSWGWIEKDKRNELFEERSRYLIAIKESVPIAFIHIRFEQHDVEDVLYIYELQVEDQYQRIGLGRFLMQAAEFIGLKNKMDYVLLTVFLANAPACQFYRNLQYQPHKTSPEFSNDDPLTTYTYQILFKSLVKKGK
jgi:ribosomal protein S18 acetylase RimI-like enzyme